MMPDDPHQKARLLALVKAHIGSVAGRAFLDRELSNEEKEWAQQELIREALMAQLGSEVRKFKVVA